MELKVTSKTSIPRNSSDSYVRGGASVKLRLAIAAVLATGALPAFSVRAADNALQEIVVTARKVAENVQDVPMSIGVYTSKDIANLGISKFEDYATRAPSVSFISIGPNTQSFFMRGVSDGSNPNYPNASTTGFFVDDMSMSNSGSIPDLHLYDVKRIEVLNGPQGTLYGAGSMSGAIRIITKKADTHAFAAGVDVDGGKIADGGGDNSSYEGYVNIPIIDGMTGIRVAVWDVHQGGFINNLLETRNWVNGTTSSNAAWAGRNYNTEHVQGARVSLSQNLPAEWKLTLTGMYQGQLYHGAWDEDRLRYGPRQVARFGPEYGNNYVRSLDLHVDGDAGIANLVYAGTYSNLPYHRVEEYSEYTQYANAVGVSPAWIQSFTCQTGPLSVTDTTPFSGCNVPVMYTDQRGYTERTSHELRLESKPGSAAHWVLGAFTQKTYEYGGTRWIYPGVNFNGAPAQNLINYYGNVAQELPYEWYTTLGDTNTRETTEFGDITYDLTKKWSIEAGVEHFHSNVHNHTDYIGYFWNAKTPSDLTRSTTKNNFKAGLQYKASETSMYYFSFGQGFRDGGINSVPTSCTKVPSIYKPDTLDNFEIGWKSSYLDGRAIWDGAVYYMNWQGYQTRVYDLSTCPVQFNANLGAARVRGVESNVSYELAHGLTINAAASYNDSHLLSNQFQSTTWVVQPGERLPNVPILTFSGSIRYEHAIDATLRGYVQLDDAHKGSRWSDLRVASTFGLGRRLEPAYDIANLRAGVDGDGGHWEAEAYVTNITDTKAVVFVNTANYDHRDTTNEPRVVGVRIKYRFGSLR